MRELGELFERLLVQLRDHPMRGKLVYVALFLAAGFAVSSLGSLIGAVRGPNSNKVTIELPSGAAGSGKTAMVPSFSCAKATRWRELFVCSAGNEQVELDLGLSAAFHRLARQLDADGDRRLLNSQSAWLDRAEKCKGMPDPAACLIAMTKSRISELDSAAIAIDAR